MRIFLTGGTGYIGAAVGRALAGAGHEVRALAHHDDARSAFEAEGWEPVPGGLRDTDVLARGAADADGVVHAGKSGEEDSGSVDAAAVDAMLEALGGGRPLVYTSGCWILGDTGESVAGEDFAIDPAEVVRWRPAVERAVLSAGDVRGVVVRPAIVYGGGGGIVGSLAAEARESGRVRVVGDGRQLWPFVHLDDLADLYVRLLDAPAGSLWHAADGPSARAWDVALAVCRAAGRDARPEAWPLEEARAARGGVAAALAMDQRLSGAAARRELGWRPGAPTLFEEILEGSYAAGGGAGGG